MPRTSAHPIPQSDGRLTARAAAARLGVKPATLYAYVSRGLLRSERAPDGRTSLFDPAEVEALAGRGRGGGAPRQPGAEPAIRSAITLLTGDAVFYRGQEAGALAGTRTFEETAEWLWSGVFPASRAAWRSAPAALRAGAEAQARLPEDALLLDRLRLIVAAAAPLDEQRDDLRPPSVQSAARSLLAAMVDGLPAARPPLAGPLIIGGAAAPTASLAARLWVRLSPSAPGMLDALNAALVLLADHELAPSTLAARIAASVRADVYAVVCAGLGVLGGALHGAASLAVEDALADLAQPEAADALISERLRRGELFPGFGHRLYAAGDPRARVLLRLVRAATRDEPLRLARVDALLEAAQERGLPPPNVDFALGALTHVAGMVRGSGEAIFAVARTAGWVAHALEEYASPTVFRPRTEYRGEGVGSRQ